MGRRPTLALTLAFAVLALVAPLAGARAAQGFGDWAAVVVAGDDRAAHDDTPTAAFDNARRDVAAGLVARGFSTRNIAQFSLHPEAYPGDHAAQTSLKAVALRLRGLAGQTSGGCLIYFTSHGAPAGIVVDDRLVPPRVMASLTRYSCGRRPTAVILSACFSGVFVAPLEAPNRMVFTAARRDRSSFGCSEDDRYPFFDGCVIADLPAARDFLDLADRVRVCVAKRERAEGMTPPSQPQLFVGRDFAAALRPFAGGPPPS